MIGVLSPTPFGIAEAGKACLEEDSGLARNEVEGCKVVEKRIEKACLIVMDSQTTRNIKIRR